MLHLSNRDRPALLTLSVIAAAYLLPLLAADRPYADDFGQFSKGYSAWTVSGRPLADWLVTLLQGGPPLTDLSPLPQLAAVALAVGCCFVLFRVLDDPRLHPAAIAVCLSLVLLNPFALQANAYLADSPPFAAAMLLGVIAAMPSSRSWPVSLLTGAGVVTLACTMYQVAINVTVAATILFAVTACIKGRPPGEIISLCLINLGRIVIGLAIYFPPAAVLAPLSQYARQHGVAVAFTLDGLGQVRLNLEAGWRLGVGSFNAGHLGFLAAGFALAAGTTAAAALVYVFRRYRSAPGLLVALLTVLSPALLLLAVPGINLGFQDPILEPRTYLAFGIVLIFVLWIPLQGMLALWPRPGSRGIARYAQWLPIAPAWICLSIAFAFGNVQAAQRDLDRDIAMRVKRGLWEMRAQEPTFLAVEGTMPWAAPALPQFRKFPILSVLVPRYLNGSWDWGWHMLRYHGLNVDLPDYAAQAQAIAATAKQAPDYQDGTITLLQAPGIVVLRFNSEQ